MRKIMTENSIFITDENGKEIQMHIYLTTEFNNKKYVVVYNEQNEDELIPFIYDDDGNLYQIENEEDLKFIDEIVGAYEEEN